MGAFGQVLHSIEPFAGLAIILARRRAEIVHQKKDTTVQLPQHLLCRAVPVPRGLIATRGRQPRIPC